ncbi:MAG TPA: glycosyltransferase family A protein [Flavisolibacter sp.]|jgi:glycosyltransferase involved in cell wall biosynthesis|nr:glycosyltransferase family A protein [Flavisolibacter sp.]
MPENNFKISVIICTYNRADYIINAVESLYQQTLSKDAFEVFVVDNNSIDNTGELVQEYMTAYSDFHLHYITETRQGASFARNTGSAFARSPLLCFMDDDAVAERDYLERILIFFKNNPDATGLGGRIIPRYIPEEPKWMSHHVSSMVGNFDYSKTVTEFKPGKYPLESNMIVRKKDFDAINGFNTALPGVKGTLRIGGEGKDFFLRLQQRGAKIFYDPNIVVHHVVEVKKLTPHYLYRVASGYGRGERVRMKEKGGAAFAGKVAEYIFKLGAAVVLGAGYALRGNPAQTWPIIKFRIDALKGLLEK